MKIENIISLFDFDNFDYCYHMTEKGIGDLICEEGLLVDGTNIKGVKNIKDTTTIDITPDMVSSLEDFIDFVEGEVNSNLIRDTSEMVIIGSPKGFDKKIVSDYSQTIDDHYYQGLINKNLIMGYIDDTLTFIPNENYAFGNDEFEDYLYENDRLTY